MARSTFALSNRSHVSAGLYTAAAVIMENLRSFLFYLLGRRLLRVYCAVANLERFIWILVCSIGEFVSAMIADDIVLLEQAMPLYDALYAWCKSTRDETHSWLKKKQ